MDFGQGAMKSSASVMSFGTAKSSFSKVSRKSTITAQDALITSQATGQAVQAARAILKAGGSELTALKTAKAAAVSALMPEPSAENEMTSGIGTSFLRRRRLKRRAEIVASMALASALVNLSNDWDGTTSCGSLQGMKLVGGPTSSETSGVSMKESSSLSEDPESRHPAQLSMKESSSLSEDLETRNPKPRPSAAERVSQQLMMIPSLTSTFSGSCGSRPFSHSGESGGFGRSGGSSSGASGGSSWASSGENSFARQVLTSTKGQSTYFSDPHNLLPNRTKHGKRGCHHDKCTVFQSTSGCLSHSYSDDYSVDSERASTDGAVDSVLLSLILNALTCGSSTASTTRSREVRVPNRMDDISEAGEYDEESVAHDDYDDLKVQLRHRLERIKEKEEEEEEGEEDRDGENVMTSPNVVKNDSTVADHGEAPLMNTSGSSAAASIGTTSEDILLDILASDPSGSRRISTGGMRTPAVIASSKKYELRVPTASDSIDDSTMDGMTDAVEEHDENSNYVQLVPVQRRNRRLHRGYLRVGGLTPVSQSLGFKLDAPGMFPAVKGSPLKTKMGFFRKKSKGQK
jgi:hypothetical protein